MSLIIATSTAPASLSRAGSSSTLRLYAETPVSPSPPVAVGNNSIALGSGAQTTVGALNSLAIGSQSIARHRGAIVTANGRFASSGDVQAGRYMPRTATVGNNPAELFLNGTSGGERLVLPDDSTWTYKITVTAHRQDAPGGHAGYTFQGVVYRATGANTIAMLGKPIKSVLAESNAAWDINIGIDTTQGALTLTAVGEAGKIIRWAALIETLEVTN